MHKGRILLALALVAPVPALAQSSAPQSITVTLSAQEAQMVTSVLDGQIKAGGYQAAKQISPIIDKIIAAAQAAAQPKTEPSK